MHKKFKKKRKKNRDNKKRFDLFGIFCKTFGSNIIVWSWHGSSVWSTCVWTCSCVPTIHCATVYRRRAEHSDQILYTQRRKVFFCPIFIILFVWKLRETSNNYGQSAEIQRENRIAQSKTGRRNCRVWENYARSIECNLKGKSLFMVWNRRKIKKNKTWKVCKWERDIVW